MVLWIDKYKLGKENVGVAIYQKDKKFNSYKRNIIFLRKNKEMIDEELWVIANNLEIVKKQYQIVIIYV